MIIVLSMVFGLRLANWVRWVMLAGWFLVCYGGVFLMDWIGLLFWQGCRKPIGSEEERLSDLVHDILKRVDPDKHWIERAREPNPVEWVYPKVRFLIQNDPKRPNGSFGFRTILISSGTLPLASDGELQGILAHELGHLRDGERVMEAAFFTAGLLAQLFRLGCRLIRWGFRVSVAGGLILLGILSPALSLLLIFYLVDGVFRVLRLGLRRWVDFRQDAFACRIGCGKGLQAWLTKTGLTANASRIRRLEKML
jgi:Zn-dependent protease with chaperone function